MSGNVLRRIINVAIAFAVIFFSYGLVRIIVDLPPHERFRAIATVLVVSVVLASVGWAAGFMRPKG